MTQNQVVGYKLMAYVLLKAAFSCQTKKISLDSSSLVDQKPSLLFAYQFSYFQILFRLSQEPLSHDPSPVILTKRQQSWFFNISKEFRDLHAFVKHR